MAKLVLDFPSEEEAEKFLKAWNEDDFLVVGPDHCDGGMYYGTKDEISIAKVSDG